jgi:hypothetical protein
VRQQKKDLGDLLASVARADSATRPQGPSQSRSTFKHALEKFKEQLRNNIHMFGEPAQMDTVIPVENTTEFHRVWSAIQVTRIVYAVVIFVGLFLICFSVYCVLPSSGEQAQHARVVWRGHCVGGSCHHLFAGTAQ